VSKKSLWVESKSNWVKDGSASYLLRAKSKLGLGQAFELLICNDEGRVTSHYFQQRKIQIYLFCEMMDDREIIRDLVSEMIENRSINKNHKSIPEVRKKRYVSTKLRHASTPLSKNQTSTNQQISASAGQEDDRKVSDLLYKEL